MGVFMYIAYYMYMSRTLLCHKGVNTVCLPEFFQAPESQGRILQWIIEKNQLLTLVQDQEENGKIDNLRWQFFHWRAFQVEEGR